MIIKNRSIYFFCIPALCLVVFGCKKFEEINDRPNIILIMSDDQGWMDVGYQEHPYLRTPNIDQVAQSGVKLSRFYSYPVCSPTRASVLTGKDPNRFGIISANKGHLPFSETTLAEILKANGYRTGHFGKWHLGTMTVSERDANRGRKDDSTHYSPPWLNGFDRCFSTESKVPTWDPMIMPDAIPRIDSLMVWWDPIVDPSKAKPFGTAYWNENGQKVRQELRGDDSKLILDQALDFIDEAVEGNQPFLGVVWFHAPHIPFLANEQFTGRYKHLSKMEQHYFGSIEAMDKQIGRLYRRLSELNITENTLVWFCSDNGPAKPDKRPGSAGPLRGGKGSLWEGGIRVPSFVTWPKRIKAGSRCEIPIITNDIMPTLLDMLNIHPVVEMDGSSVYSTLLNTDTQYQRYLALKYLDQQAVISNDYKLISTGQISNWQIFNIIDDVGEQNDLSQRKLKIMEDLIIRYGDYAASIPEIEP